MRALSFAWGSLLMEMSIWLRRGKIAPFAFMHQHLLILLQLVEKVVVMVVVVVVMAYLPIVTS